MARHNNLNKRSRSMNTTVYCVCIMVSRGSYTVSQALWCFSDDYVCACIGDLAVHVIIWVCWAVIHCHFIICVWPGCEVERSETNSPMCPSMFYSRYTTPKHTQEAHSLNGSICYSHTLSHIQSDTYRDKTHCQASAWVSPLLFFFGLFISPDP